MLLAAYNFDGSTDTINDYSGNGNNFSLAGTNVVRTTGHTAQGITSNGSTPAILPDIGRTAQRTISTWMKGIHTYPEGWVIIFNVPSLDSGGWGILHLGGNLSIQARNSSGFARAQIANPTDGLWHHLTGTYDGSNIRLYIDATLVATEALAGPLRTDTNPPAIFGVNTTSILSDLRIYDEALNQSAISDIMNTPVEALKKSSGFFL